MPMVPERKALLVAALRSGEFSQAKSMLHNADTGGYCCLGVACEVYRRETGDGEWRQEGGDLLGRYKKFLNCDLDLPNKVAEWFGLPEITPGRLDTSPSVVYTDEYGYKHSDALTNLNDDKGMTFDEIADAIENDPNI